MSQDSVRGKVLRFSFDDGPMAKKTFDHRFDENGTVTFEQVESGKTGGDDKKKAPGNPATKYELATVRDGVCAVSYLSSAGFTLTAVLDFATKKLVAFSSNEKVLGVQHGTFQEISPAAARETTPRTSQEAHPPRH
jgi:hypothetical protein